MKKPIRGEIWVSEKSAVLITDVYKKKKTDRMRINDDYWNEALPGQVFVYGVSEWDNCTVTGKEYLESFLEKYSFLEKLMKCLCPNCDRYHPRWGKYREYFKNG